MHDRVIWTNEMVAAITEFRSQGLSVARICEKLGVNEKTFRRFRRLTGFRMTPLRNSKHTLIGWYDPITPLSPTVGEDTCKNQNGLVGAAGECLACDAECGETCRLPNKQRAASDERQRGST